jgi:hypothetical protein
MKAIEHLENARDELEAAREKSSLGTRLMITELIETLTDLIDRTENINDDTE